MPPRLPDPLLGSFLLHSFPDSRPQAQFSPFSFSSSSAPSFHERRALTMLSAHQAPLVARPCGAARRARHAIPTRAVASPAAGGLDGAVQAYASLTRRFPPVLTAATVPVVAVSILCKAFTGSGLPGALGALEGLAWLILPLGAGALAPRVSELLAGGDLSTSTILSVLNKPGCACEARCINSPASCCCVCLICRFRQQSLCLRKRRRNASTVSRPAPTRGRRWACSSRIWPRRSATGSRWILQRERRSRSATGSSPLRPSRSSLSLMRGRRLTNPLLRDADLWKARAADRQAAATWIRENCKLGYSACLITTTTRGRRAAPACHVSSSLFLEHRESPYARL